MRFWYQLGVILDAKIHPNRVIEASWARFEGVLGRLGGILGPSWAHLAAVLARLGPFWGVLGASKDVLKASRLAKRGQGGRWSDAGNEQSPVGPRLGPPPPAYARGSTRLRVATQRQVTVTVTVTDKNNKQITNK